MDYNVGYGKPSLHTRFRKGRSGNPAGRPPRPKDLASAPLTALDRPVGVSRGAPPATPPRLVTAGGRRRRANWREAIVAGLVERAAAGDLPATRLLVELMCRLEPAAPEPEYDEDDGEDPREWLKAKLNQMAAAAAAQAAAEAANAAPSAQPSDAPGATRQNP